MRDIDKLTKLSLKVLNKKKISPKEKEFVLNHNLNLQDRRTYGLTTIQPVSAIAARTASMVGRARKILKSG